MSRLIDADKLIEKAKLYSPGYYDSDEQAVAVVDIKNAPTVATYYKWASVREDGLPKTESDQEYLKILACDKSGQVATGSYNSKWGFSFGHYFGEVVGWMLSPEPMQEESDGN